jgi:hypothetical protein
MFGMSCTPTGQTRSSCGLPDLYAADARFPCGLCMT